MAGLELETDDERLRTGCGDLDAAIGKSLGGRGKRRTASLSVLSVVLLLELDEWDVGVSRSGHSAI